jgi:hypothetical protein
MDKLYKKYKSKYLRLQSGGDYDLDLIKYLREKGIEIDSYFNSDSFIGVFNLNNLVINNEKIKEIYNEHHYLELRKYNNEKKLIVGCGNRRLDDRNLHQCTTELKCNQIFENIYHSHTDAFTIDLSLLANPSIVARFSEESFFATIPDNSFDIIIFEGGGGPEDNPDEIKRLLNSKNLSFCIGMDDGIYRIYSYWREQDYTIVP